MSIDPFFTTPLKHSFTHTYEFTCKFCGNESRCTNKRAVSCTRPECRSKSIQFCIERRKARKKMSGLFSIVVSKCKDAANA